MKEIARSKQQGQTLIEFALLLPVLLLIVVVIFDLGRAVYYYSAIYNAAREGARYGVIKPNDAIGMRTTAVNYAYGVNLKLSDVTAGLGPDETAGGFTFKTVQVVITYSFSPATPLVSRLLPGGQLILRSRAIMRTETLP